MDMFQDELCFILDLDGFFLNKTFHERDPYETLKDKDKCTVHFVKSKIHTLTYQPTPNKHFLNPIVLGILAQSIYNTYSQVSQGKRTVVGYNGGHIEKDLLRKLNIPSLNLETLGCSKYDVLRTGFLDLLPSCRFHQDDKLHHCPLTKCHAKPS